MKKLISFVFTALLLVTFAGIARADLMEEYGVKINDANPFKDGNNLYQLFNKYFGEQLGTDGFENSYNSSNDLFKERGVDPNTDWTTNGSQLVGAFKVAALGHVLSVFGSDGTFVGSVLNMSGTNNIQTPDGITDLGGINIADIANGLHVDFQLDAYNGSKLVNSWSSDPSENSDGKIHVVALEITDLYNAKYGTDNRSVYMFGWEDLPSVASGGMSAADWDYQDFVVIMTNLEAGYTPSNLSPEPATMLILGLGLGIVPLSRRFRKAA